MKLTNFASACTNGTGSWAGAGRRTWAFLYLRMKVTQSDFGSTLDYTPDWGWVGCGVGVSVVCVRVWVWSRSRAVKCGDKWVKVMRYMRWYSGDTPARASLMKSFKYIPHTRSCPRITTHSTGYFLCQGLEMVKGKGTRLVGTTKTCQSF